MSKEHRRIEVSVIVHSPDNLPVKDGEQMYADDVMAEMSEAVEAAVAQWYQRRGRELLATEPIVV